MTAHTYNLLAGLAGSAMAMFALAELAPNGLLIYLLMLVAGVAIVVISYRNTLEGK